MKTQVLEQVLNTENAPRRFAVSVKGDQELSKQVQQYLFEHLNAVWSGRGGKQVQYADEDVLFIEKSVGGDHYYIAYGTQEYFENVRERTPEVFVKKSGISLVQNINQVEVNGKMYDEAVIANLLKVNGL